MCYKCEVPGCGEVVPAGLDQKKFTQYREVKRKELAGMSSGNPIWRELVRKEVASELRVCHGCFASLQLMPLAQLVKFKAEGKDHAAHMQPAPPPPKPVASVLAAKPVGELLGQRRRKKNRCKEGNGQPKPHPARG